MHHTHDDVNRTYYIYIHGSRLAVRKSFLHMRRIDVDIRNITQWGQPVIAYNLVQLSVKKVMRAVGKDIVITVFPSPCQQQFFRQFIGKTFCMHLTSPSCSLLFLQHSSLCSTFFISKIVVFLLDSEVSSRFTVLFHVCDTNDCLTEIIHSRDFNPTSEDSQEHMVRNCNTFSYYVVFFWKWDTEEREFIFAFFIDHYN